MSDDKTDWPLGSNHESIAFYRNSTEIGRLTFEDDGTLIFTGDVDNSAHVLFDEVVRINNQKIKNMDEIAHIVQEVGTVAFKQGMVAGAGAALSAVVIVSWLFG